MNAVCDGFDLLDLTGHLFVTIVPGESIGTDDGFGFALYQSGLSAIAVAGLKPDSPDITDADFLEEIRTSILHECVHYWQDIQGRLDGSQENEDEAERVAKEISYDPKAVWARKTQNGR